MANELSTIFIGGVVTISWFLFCYLIVLLIERIKDGELHRTYEDTKVEGIKKIFWSGCLGLLILIMIFLIILLFYVIGGLVLGEFFFEV